ncbi:tetratricopeptide repeat-containing sulfotransferase family protein [Sphingomonas oligophenolica]|uniref:Sulfotransferase family protein n=1 Tax=Sphingomonas oligophenolica TaxID=301154 RepID=A0A502CL93_9SPHN|nr:sulfotransferase [Sphingomonas oligophenolica]TPG13593.1 sulfotransferase family protein [Sphingomonas oligophenolica]
MTTVVRLLDDLQRAFAARDRVGINDILAAMLKGSSDVGDRWGMFADILANHGEWTLAIRAARRHCERNPADTARGFGEAVILARAGRNADAAAVAGRLQAKRPADPDLNHFLGALASERGAFDDACDYFQTAIDAGASAGQSWLELAAIHRFLPADPMLDRLRRAAAVTSLPADARAATLYALGKALDDIGDIDAAFAAFDQGSRMVAPLRAYDGRADRAEADAALSRAARSAPRPSGDGVERPIFVTGLPRSGTTLVEQILASHPAVVGGGELNFLAMLGNEIGAPAALRRSYLHLLAERFDIRGRVVDKTLDIGRVLDPLIAAFPRGRVVWVRRAPIDVAWSCLRTYFAVGVPWSWDQRRLAAHMRVEDRLFDHWRDRLGDRLLVVDYQALVREPATLIPSIVAHAGLTPHPATLRPHATQRTIRTSSVAQVREPISTRAIGSGDVYRDHLGPFIDAYQG